MKVTKLSDLGKMAQMGEASLTSEKPQIVLGLATCGIAAGGMPLKDFAEQYLAENDVKADIVSVGCIGLCHAEPLVDIKLPGKPRVTYDYMDTDKLKKILDEHLVGGQPVKELAMAQSLYNRNGNAREAFQDIWWVILNSNEFIFNH